MSSDLLEQFVTEIVAFDETKAKQNQQVNDFSSGEYAESDGRGPTT